MLLILPVAKMMSQPMIIYIAVVTARAFRPKTAYSTIPKTASPQIIPKIVQPSAPFKMLKQYGVYVPAIKIKIEAWSKIPKTFFAPDGNA